MFGGVSSVALGLQLLRGKLSGRSDPSDIEMARYVVKVFQLERRFKRNRVLLDAIREGIALVTAPMRFFTGKNSQEEGVHPSLAGKLA